MSDQNRHTDDLKLIRKIMEESSRFLSLSGLSGVFVGIFAIAGALFAWLFILKHDSPGNYGILSDLRNPRAVWLLLSDAIIVLLAAVGTACWLAIRESSRKGLKFWSPVTKRLIINLLIPLLAGGLFIIVLIVNQDPEYIIPVMLIFYGLALINAGKFTFGEVQYLGALELITGFFAALLPGNEIIFWLIGFGFLHILYGIIIHRKYS